VKTLIGTDLITKTIKNDKKAVSPVIATILLIVIAVATAIVVYTWAMAFVGGATTATGPGGQMQLDAYKIWNNENATFYIRNTGGITLNITQIYIDGVLHDYNGTAPKENITSGEFIGNLSTTEAGYVSGGGVFVVNYTGGDFDPGEVAYIFVRAASGITLTDGKAHTVKLVCPDGTTLAFSIRKK